LPAQVVVEVELVARLSAVAKPASSPYDASQPAPAAPDIGGASPIVAVTTGPTYSLQG
ncbi:hypothetical protein A2U01_0071524, partial [Trifolium medium]|nr:hypothetical protein [Trifolium medium]